MNGNIRVSHRPPEPEFLSTLATSYCPPSSDAHSTCTEEPRPSMSSRTDESVFEIEEHSEKPHPSEEFHSVAIKDMSKPEVLLPSPPRRSTILKSAKMTDSSAVSGDTETRYSRRHRLVLVWKKSRSLQRRALQRRAFWRMAKAVWKGFCNSCPFSRHQGNPTQAHGGFYDRKLDFEDHRLR